MLFSGTITLSALFFFGCATPLSISEIMQEPEGTNYYLAHNVWTHGRRSISSINYQVGDILPFATHIQIVKATKSAVRFRVVSSGAEYTIRYSEKYGMTPIDVFIKQLITTETPDEIKKGISSEFLDSMIRGEVLLGMTRKEVILTYGPPSPHRTPNQDLATWVYWIKKWPISRTSRIIFKGDKVVHIMK